MDEFHRVPASEHRLDDLDLYCLRCRYNLRGISGDPRRCPECGVANAVGEQWVPTAFISRELWRLQMPAVACAFVFVMGLTLLAVVVLESPIEAESSQRVGMIACPILFLSWFWALFAARFRIACAARRSWWWVLLRIHLYGLVLWMLTAVSIGLSHEALGAIERAPLPRFLIVVAAELMVVLLVSLVFMVWVWVARDMRRIAEPLLWNRAVMQARIELWRQLGFTPPSRRPTLLQRIRRVRH